MEIHHSIKVVGGYLYSYSNNSTLLRFVLFMAGAKILYTQGSQGSLHYEKFLNQTRSKPRYPQHSIAEFLAHLLAM